MQNKQLIGVFDSGVGGTSIWKEIITRMPNESTLYLADSINAPYGSKSTEEILALSIKNTERLLAMGAKIIVVACNTATTNAIDYLRASYDVPFIGIEPAIKPAALGSKTGAIGILATRGTLNSALFHQTSSQFASDVKIVEVIGEGLVPLIESGDLESEELKKLLKRYIQPMLDAHVDHIVLGCSHYPYLIPQLTKLLPAEVTIIDSGLAVAKQTQVVLTNNSALSQTLEATHQLFTNRDSTILKRFVSGIESTLEGQSSIAVDYLKF